MLPREVETHAAAAPRLALIDGPSAEPLPPPALSSGPDALALLKAFRRRWLLALALAVLAAGGAIAAVWLLLPANYMVSAQIQVASRRPSLMGSDAADGRSEFTTYLKTQMGQVKSRYVLLAALKRDEVKRLDILRQHPEPLTLLDEEIKVENQEGSELLTVYMNGSEPGQMVPLINAITQTYLHEVVHKEEEARRNRQGELEKHYTVFNQTLRSRRDDWHKMAGELNTSDANALTHKQMMLLNTFGEIRKQHAQIHFEVMRAKGQLEGLKAQAASLDTLPLPDTIVSEAADADPISRGHIALMARWDEYIDHYKKNTHNPEQWRGYRDAIGEKESLVKKVDARKEELRAGLLQRYRQRARAEHESAVAQLQNYVGPLESQEKVLLAEVQRLAQEADKIGTRSTTFEMLGNDIKRDEKIAEKMAAELEQLRLPLPARVSIFQEAAAQRKDRKRQLMALIGAPVVAFLGVCFAVSYWEFRRRRIHTTDEVLSNLGMRVVGSVPAFPRNVPVPLLSDSGPTDGSEHSLLESIDAIRTLLLHDASLGTTRVLMVTSAVAGEGKTTLATHLAGSLARAGRRTLLLDCDLRRPSIHEMFELPPQPGLSEVLLGEVHLAEATLATPIDGLWVVPAGQWDRNVMQALAKDAARVVFDKLKTEYDFVIVDSHPVLPATDSLLIGQYVDAVIFALLRDVSQMPKVYAARQRLASLGVRVLGAVVNGTQEESYGEGYHYAAPQQQA